MVLQEAELGGMDKEMEDTVLEEEQNEMYTNNISSQLV